ncbi:MAG: type IX secretion system membrane protein PorP/SprF [bacterium]|nr:type IX secretion system membrane protein PorP/SprF [bacterium]
MKTTGIIKISLFSALLSFSLHLNAQYDAMFTQYMFNEVFINPAYAGSKEAMSATLLHRQQWVNFPGRPITTSFSLHGPVQGNKMGLGLSVLNEKIGVLNRSLVYGSYAYRIKINDKSTFSMGLMGGFENQLNKYGTVKVSNDGSAPADPQFAQNTSNVVAPNFGAGLYYTSKKYYVGLSIPRLVDNEVKFSYGGSTVKVTSITPDKFTYYLTGGYLFTINEELKVRANTMIKTVKNAPAQIDLGGTLLIRDLIWAGLSYRSKSSLSALLGVQATKQFFICYSYDYGVNKIQQYSQGSHEIVLNYLFSFTSKNIITPRYF